jgi:predicted SnoaL-like aldol condensation-catalyzing enzyme
MKKNIITLCAVVSIFIFTAGCSKDDDLNPNASSNRNLRQEENNKQLVLKFYQRLFGDKDVSAIDEYIVPDYIQHNPQVADGREALKTMATQWIAGGPQTTVDIRKSIAEGNLVILHVKNPTPDGKYLAIVEIFRVEGNQIVEHWDVIQTAPDNSANPHPMF